MISVFVVSFYHSFKKAKQTIEKEKYSKKKNLNEKRK